MVGSAQRVVMARARAPRDAAVQQCLKYLGSSHPDFELEGSARSVVQFEGVLPEAASCDACAPVDLDGQVGIMVDVTLEVYKFVCLVVHLARCLYVEYGGGLRLPFARKHVISVLASNTVRPNAAHTTTITPIIFLSCSGGCKTTSASSA